MATILENCNSSNSQAEMFEFTLILSGIDEITEDVENALFEAGCDDALLGMQDGEVYLDFSRESESLPVAILSAVQSVGRSKIEGVEVVEVRPPNMAVIDLINTFLKCKYYSGHNSLASELELFCDIKMPNSPGPDSPE